MSKLWFFGRHAVLAAILTGAAWHAGWLQGLPAGAWFLMAAGQMLAGLHVATPLWRWVCFSVDMIYRSGTFTSAAQRLLWSGHTRALEGLVSLALLVNFLAHVCWFYTAAGHLLAASPAAVSNVEKISALAVFVSLWSWSLAADAFTKCAAVARFIACGLVEK